MPYKFASKEFEIDENWLKHGDDITLGIVHGIVVTDTDEIIIQHVVPEESTNKDCLIVANPQGEVLRTIKVEGSAFPHGLTLHKENGQDVLYFSDCKKGLFKTSMTGEILWHVERPELYQILSQLHYEPSNTAIDSNGTVHFTDGYGSYYIIKFDTEGNELGAYGGPGIKEEQLIHPHGLAVCQYQGEEVIVIPESPPSGLDKPMRDKYNAHTKIKIFDLDGNLKAAKNIDALSPRILSEYNGQWLMPDFQGRIILLDENFEYVESIGKSDERFASQSCTVDYPLVRPHDIGSDSQGNLYMADYTGKVLKFSCTG